MKKTFKYRLYPTKSQKAVLIQTLETCRNLYNDFLEERIQVYDTYGFGLTYRDQQNNLPEMRAKDPGLAAVHSQVLQDVAKRVDRAYQSFFRRVKNGEKPGFPRFRGKDRHDSFTFPQSGFSLLGNVVRLSGIGKIPLVYHRPVEGKIKTCTVRRNSCGEWFVCFSCENVTPKDFAGESTLRGDRSRLDGFSGDRGGANNPQSEVRETFGQTAGASPTKTGRSKSRDESPGEEKEGCGQNLQARCVSKNRLFPQDSQRPGWRIRVHFCGRSQTFRNAVVPGHKPVPSTTPHGRRFFLFSRAKRQRLAESSGR